MFALKFDLLFIETKSRRPEGLYPYNKTRILSIPVCALRIIALRFYPLSPAPAVNAHPQNANMEPTKYGEKHAYFFGITD